MDYIKYRNERIKAQAEYIKQVLTELNEQYDNRTDDFELHGLLGRAMGALKGVKDTLETL